MDKFLFLDIDDVIVTSIQHSSKKLHPKYKTHMFDKKCVDVLNIITDKTNPIIILSSDWKLYFDIEALNEIFSDNNVHCKISDITPDLWGTQFTKYDQLEICRASEIMKYVDEHSIKNFVAVDDLDLNDWIPNNFVHCKRSMEGIKQTGIKEKILNILT